MSEAPEPEMPQQRRLHGIMLVLGQGGTAECVKPLGAVNRLSNVE
jgi:hypothetical protein